MVEREYCVPSVPLPGSTAPIAYLPQSPADSLDFQRRQVEYPDPGVARGWSAGMFEIPPLGERCANPPDPDLDAERDLFRTGRRLEAKVIGSHMQLLQFSPHGENQHYTLRLLADGTEYETKVWAHGECVPSEGHLIQIAVSPDGSQVALDTDERYYGPPGRALVWTVPFEQTEAGLVQAATAQLNERLQIQLDRIDAMHAAGKLTDAAYEQARANILGAMGEAAGSGEPPAHTARSPQAQTMQLAAVSKMHADGKLTDEQFETAKARLLGD
jgi:Short C-terminal domain